MSTDIMPREKFMPLSEAKTKLFELVRDAEETDVLLMRHGRPAGVIVGYERWQRVIDTLDELEDALSVYQARDERSIEQRRATLRGALLHAFSEIDLTRVGLARQVSADSETPVVPDPETPVVPAPESDPVWDELIGRILSETVLDPSDGEMPVVTLAPNAAERVDR